ncbi:type I restriction endonuclease subunit R, EcoR124 family [Staphylococcus aureus]
MKTKRNNVVTKEQIRRILDHADDPTLRLKRDLIREFIDNVVPSLNKDDDIDQIC